MASKGRIEQHRERLIGRMIDKGVEKSFAERVFSQIEGFGEYGFPESHAASFALLSYVTAWLKRHHAAAFTCAMLDAQPMGFYAPSTLVEDAARHGVVVRPVDVRQSLWDCSLEADASSAGGLALRMGLRYVKGFGEREKEALAPWSGPWESLEHFVRTTQLSKRALVRLSETGALDTFGYGRREAIWQVRGLAPHARDPLPLTPAPRRVALPELQAAETIAWDYRASAHSTRGHPMGQHRGALRGSGIPDARTLNQLPDGHQLTYVGMVICRQRPGTASGVTFFTMEDETGLVNVVVWRRVFERRRLIGKTAKLLGIRGKLQVAEGVTHLVADDLFVPELEEVVGAVAPPSRDFH